MKCMLTACNCSQYHKLQSEAQYLRFNFSFTLKVFPCVFVRCNLTTVFNLFSIQPEFVLFSRCDNSRRAHSFSCRPLCEVICLWSCECLWLSGVKAEVPTWFQNAALSGNADAVRHTNLHHLHRSALCFPKPAACGGWHRRGEWIHTYTPQECNSGTPPVSVATLDSKQDFFIYMFMFSSVVCEYTVLGYIVSVVSKKWLFPIF